jgi:DNA-binding winged helix-turn-helix (wHTH) protein
MGRTKARIITMLVEKTGEVVTYDELIVALWPRDVPRMRACACLRSHINQLRDMMGPAMILTAPGCGYVWAGLADEKRE